jgi:hypothetical protein
MSNPTNTPDSTPDFDLFGVPDEDNLKEQLAKGTFQWTNKYTRILAVVLVLVGCLSAGAVYGHYEATKSSSGGLTAGNLSSLRSAFASAGGASALAGASGASGFAGGGFSRGTSGTVAKVSGNTVTITLTTTPTTPIKVGDNVTVRGATTGAAAGLTGGAGTSTSGPASGSSAGAAAGAPAGAGTASGAPRAGGAGGRFSNPAFTACLAKAGVTFTAGSRPDFTDPKVAAAIQSCGTSLGLSAPGAPGAGGSGFGGGTGRSASPATPAPAASPSN